MTQPTPACPGAPPELPAELAHLFRHALRDGRIHPLMPLVLRYRQEQALAQQQAQEQACAAAAASTPPAEPAP